MTDYIMKNQLTTGVMTNLAIGILTSALWHGIYQWSSPSLAMSCSSVCLLNLFFLSMPNCRLKIRSISAAYRDVFFLLFIINRIFTEVSHFQDRPNLTKNVHLILIKHPVCLLSSVNVFYLHGFVIIRYVIWISCRRFLNDDNLNLPRSNYDDGVCAICMLGPQEIPSSPDCGHTYCYECLSRWSRIRTECPMCTRRFTSFLVFPTEESAQHQAIRVYSPDFLIDDYPPTIEINFNAISGWFCGLMDILKSTGLFIINLWSVFNFIVCLAELFYYWTQAFRALSASYLHLFS